MLKTKPQLEKELEELKRKIKLYSRAIDEGTKKNRYSVFMKKYAWHFEEIPRLEQAISFIENALKYLFDNEPKNEQSD